MRSVEDRVHGAERVNGSNALTGAINCKVGKVKSAKPVLLRRKRAFSQIQRQVLEEPSVVVIGLRFALTKWVNRHSETRRPVVCQSVMGTRAVLDGAEHCLCFPAQTKQTCDVLIEAPCVL